MVTLNTEINLIQANTPGKRLDITHFNIGRFSVFRSQGIYIQISSAKVRIEKVWRRSVGVAPPGNYLQLLLHVDVNEFWQGLFELRNQPSFPSDPWQAQDLGDVGVVDQHAADQDLW
jgi:hypothetical protein